MTLAFALLFALVTPQADSPGIRILKEAMAKEKDPAALERALIALGQEMNANPRVADNHYARGWVLSRLKRTAEAIAAYDEAARLDPKLADAPYNAGVILARSGREEEAALRFDAAVAADPKHVDALYNAGQSYYNRKDFAKALDRWLKARTLTPEDFNVVKKVLQAQNAAGDSAGAAQTRHELFELRRNSKDPSVRNLKAYVFDQFDVGKAHVFAYETFEPTGDLYSVYRFQVANASNRAAGSVNLESSAVLREQGTPYILGVDIGSAHKTPGPAYKELPSVSQIKPEVVKLIEAHFPELVKGSP